MSRWGWKLPERQVGENDITKVEENVVCLVTITLNKNKVIRNDVTKSHGREIIHKP